MSDVQLGQCRWALDCTDEAVTRVEVKALPFPVEACEDHAEEHHTWKTNATTRLNPGPEPLPECFCPDPEVLGDDPRPDYCPRHGTPQRRGLEEWME